MASVWVARLRGKRGFENLVAIKTVLPQHAGEPVFQTMALDEARIVAGIRHPNVASIVDVGEHDGLLYLVFEFVDGAQLSSLRKAVSARAQDFPLNIALRLMADACAGLHAAHELADQDDHPLGIVHRDVSPQNILVTASGGVKIIDFGVARAENRVADQTEAGMIKGKILYMPPEQASGSHVDRRADIWGAGAVLYELLTGRPPIEGDTPVATIRMLIAGTRPAPLPSQFPVAVAELVARALAVHPADRFQTAADMHRALERALAELCGPTTSADVASFVDTFARDELRARRKCIASFASRISQLVRDEEPDDLPCSRPDLARRNAQAEPPPVTVSERRSPFERTQGLRALWTTSLVVLAGLAAGLGAWSDSDRWRAPKPSQAPQQEAAQAMAPFDVTSDPVRSTSRSLEASGPEPPLDSLAHPNTQGARRASTRLVPRKEPRHVFSNRR